MSLLTNPIIKALASFPVPVFDRHMESQEDICAICRDGNCDFETRCGHLFHEECLNVAVFSRESDADKCPYCRCKITSTKLLEKLIRVKGDFSKISVGPEDLKSLKELIKYILVPEHEKFPIDSIVLKMVELGWDVNEYDFWIKKKKGDVEHTLFYASYITGNVAVTYKLIQLGCKMVRGKDDKGGEHVLYHAVNINDVPFINYLISLGLDINSSDIGLNALNLACSEDKVDVVKCLLDNGAEAVLFKCHTELHLNCFSYVDHRFQNCIEVNAVLSACQAGSLNTIKFLHDRYPNIFQDDSNSWPAFTIAIKQENIALIDLLIALGGNINCFDSKYKRNLLMIACKCGNINVIKNVFEKGVFDVKAIDHLGNTAFLYSLTSRKNTIEIMRFLIEKGSDPLVTTKTRNMTALHLACREYLGEVAEFLLTDESCCAKFDLKNIQAAGDGLIQSAMNLSSDNVMRILDLLIQKGADINERNTANQTAIDYASDCTNEVLSFLLSHGADVNSVNYYGYNCLQNVVVRRYYLNIDKELFEIFINHRVNLNFQQVTDGDTVLHFICNKALNWNFGIMELLLDSGARTDIANNKGEFPFDVALSWNPFSHPIKVMENRGINYSKFITEEVRSTACDQCKKDLSSLKGRCGHYLHYSCLNDKENCPICGIRITLSTTTEVMIKECNFDNIHSLADHELFFLLDFFIEDDSFVDFNTIVNEVKRRKELHGDSFKFPCKNSYPEDIYAKSCNHGRLRLVQLLDSIGLDKSDLYGKVSAVALATIIGRVEMVEYFLKKFGPESIYKETFWDFYPIQYACMAGNLEVFDYLIEHGAALEDEMHLLHLACGFGSLEIAKRLIEVHGFDPNFSDYYELFPLHHASIRLDFYSKNHSFKFIFELGNIREKTDEECIEIAKYLLERGAATNTYNEACHTPVAYTGYCNREKMFDFYLEYFENVLNKPLKLKKHQVLSCITMRGTNLEFFERIIAMGADVNWASRIGYTALMGACSSGNYEMCLRLIQLGADVNARDFGNLDEYMDSSPLFNLCRDGSDNVNILELLLEHQVDISQLSENADNSLHIAARSGSLNIVKKLISIGFDPNSVRSDRQTPLHLALNSDNADVRFQIVRALVEAGADIHAVCEYGFTPLSYSSRLFETDIMEYFNSLEQSTAQVVFN